MTKTAFSDNRDAHFGSFHVGHFGSPFPRVHSRSEHVVLSLPPGRHLQSDASPVRDRTASIFDYESQFAAGCER
jgi:hypothetical protein